MKAIVTGGAGSIGSHLCYGFYRHGSHPSGDGTKYRATAEGPGVTPDVMWAADDIGPLDSTLQDQMRALERSWGDPNAASRRLGRRLLSRRGGT